MSWQAVTNILFVSFSMHSSGTLSHCMLLFVQWAFFFCWKHPGSLGSVVGTETSLIILWPPAECYLQRWRSFKYTPKLAEQYHPVIWMIIRSCSSWWRWIIRCHHTHCSRFSDEGISCQKSWQHVSQGPSVSNQHHRIRLKTPAASGSLSKPTTGIYVFHHIYTTHLRVQQF